MISLSHLPTLLVLIGYPIYWLELYAWKHPTGHTTWLATALFAAAVLIVLVRRAPALIRQHIERPSLGWMIASCCAGLILLVAGRAALLPPHLGQEFDTLNYHITLARQHLIAGSFEHLPWSSADLFVLPVDFALAPYWLATTLPNKWPQFVFFLGFLAVGVMLARKLGARHAWLVVFLFLATHGFSIQAGTAMLDIVLCYFLVAAVDSFLAGRFAAAAVEMVFFVFSKPAMPLLFLVLMPVLIGIYWVGKQLKFFQGYRWAFEPASVVPEIPPGSWQKTAGVFLAAFVLLAAPFMLKSWHHAATPLYPFACGQAGTPQCLKAQEYVSVKDHYGSGRGLKAFVEHFWVIAVPEAGVNNRFDYPLGLPFLICLVPFAWLFVRACHARVFSVLPAFCIICWILWWFGPQQSRFLFGPLALMMISVAAVIEKPSRVLLAALTAGLALTALSVVRAHGADFGKKPVDVLRAQDRALISQAETLPPGTTVTLNRPDAAFAAFPVDVKNAGSIFVIER